MPDPQPAKRRPLTGGHRAPAGPYAELHCKTNFSFLEGASHPDELVQRAGELGYAALAITDRNSVAGVVRAHVAAKEIGLKLLIGAEVTPTDAPPVVLLATDRAAYGRLCRLLTLGCRRAPKGECSLTFADLAQHAAGLLALVKSSFRRYRDVFGDRCYALAELHRGPDDERQWKRITAAARTARIPLVAANDVHYHVPGRRFLQDVLTAIRHGCPVAELGLRVFSNGERYLKPADEMAELFPADIIARTVEVADRCTFSLDELRYEYPHELCPPDMTPLDYLRRLTWEGADRRYPHGIPDKVRQLIEHELRLIEELRYEFYFLTVWDLVRFARSRGILCQGRGSAANSVVCYCLEVTSVDPDQIDVLFERFISHERNEAPDIDVDFEHERREEVLQYVYDKYGRERAGMTATVITYRPRSAVRDVGKALGLSLEQVAKSLDRTGEEKLAGRIREAVEPQQAHQLIGLIRQILGFPRHLSQHVGGMVLTQGPLCELVPIENAAMPGRTVIQWDKDDLDSLGLLKVDCLSLGMLTAIRKCFEMVGGSLATVPPDDPAVYDMICQADTMGVFQIESRAQMSMLPRLRPRCFYDLVIEVAIVRPGPIQGDMVHPYLRRRAGLEPVTFPDDRIRAVLEKTLGVPLFQEQAMRLAVVAAGFTPGEADQLRRAMGAWRRQGVIDQFRRKLLDGMQANGYSAQFAEQLFRQIRGFGEYGFPESHAASFALLVYVSAWLKCHHPAAVTVALLNSQPMGFYAPAQLITDARKHGVTVRPVDVNASDWDCTLEDGIRLGLRMVKGLSEVHGRLIAQQRPFVSVEDFSRRTRVGNAGLRRLAKADAFGSLLDRRQAQWRALPAFSHGLFDETDAAAALPAMSRLDSVIADYESSGLSLKGHPLEFIRPALERMKVVPARELTRLPVDRRYKVAGLVLLRQRPSTAKGITFVTIEDETGTANLIVRADVWDKHHRAAMSGAMIARGQLQRVESVIHLLVDRMDTLPTGVAARSRDFQ